MVQLTNALLKYMPSWFHLQKSGNSYFKKQALFFMTRYYRNIGWSTHKNAMNRFHYLLKGEQFYAARDSKYRRDYNRMRIAAACEEHGFNYPNFISTLPKIDINLNLAALARLSIYEPKTFKVLVDICREMTSDHLEPANFNPNRIEGEEFRKSEVMK